MSYRETLLASPEPVRTLLRAWLTRAAVEGRGRTAQDKPDWELYAARTLDWWGDLVRTMRPERLGITEKRLAGALLKEMAWEKTWRRVLAAIGAKGTTR